MALALDIKDALKSSSDAQSGGSGTAGGPYSTAGQRGIHTYVATHGSSLSASQGDLPQWLQLAGLAVAAIAAVFLLRKGNPK